MANSVLKRIGVGAVGLVLTFGFLGMGAGSAQALYPDGKCGPASFGKGGVIQSCGAKAKVQYTLKCRAGLGNQVTNQGTGNAPMTMVTHIGVCPLGGAQFSWRYR
ncbi:hypothetical protein NSA53_06245 [Cellulosimicrobium cellulans]|uniref:hypothetical protein n=1 Tax=Cellulosimicrobium cellulans TaxID=1710 RepID=UPI002149F7F7|nr:hypothetical protein [Cellulosimicrobium cellulans]